MIWLAIGRSVRVYSRSFAACCCLAGAVIPEAAAQSVAGGQVVRVAGGDSIPVAGTPVVLHRIGREVQGPIDSAATDARGHFRFRFAADTSSIYLVSARRDGIEYFSPAVHLNPARPDTGLRIVVADTSSVAPIELEARHLVLAAPGTDGTRHVLDVLVLRNAGEKTRVAPDTIRPSWSGPLPMGTVGLEVGEGDFSSNAVSRRDDRLLFFAPIPPGEKQIVAEYVTPAGARETRLPLDQPTSLLNVLAGEPGVEVSGPGIVFADTQLIQGQAYRRWTGAMAAGTTVRIAFPRQPLAIRWMLPALVAIVAGALVTAAALMTRRPVAAGAAGGDPVGVADGLLGRLATLDAEYRGREASVDPAEWNRYQRERARLKAELSAALRATLILVLVLAAGCGRAEARGGRGGETVVVDDAGDSITVSVPATRVVSLIPATTELAFAIGAGDRLVGRTAWCDYPAAAALVPNLGDGISPNVEAVAAQRPSLVLLYRSGQNADAAARLARLGIPALRLRTDSLVDVPRLARLIGRLTDHERAADSLATAFETDLATATVTPSGNRPTVFLLAWDHPPLTVGRGSFLTEMIERAGGANLFADIPAASGIVSIEAVASRNPDFVLTLDSLAPAFASRPEWRVVPAIREARFIHAIGSEFKRPSPRAAAAIRRLAAAIAAAGR